MKYPIYIFATLAALFTSSCNREKAAIDAETAEIKDSIDAQKEQVDARADHAAEQTDRTAVLNLARIQEARDTTQAQLDADRKIAEAEAEAAKARIDAENQ